MKEKKVIIVGGNSGELQEKALAILNNQYDVVVIDDNTNQQDLQKEMFDKMQTNAFIENMQREIPRFEHYDEMLYSHLSKKEREAKIVSIRTEPKIDRNKSCPCGSGIKYKKCCLLTNKIVKNEK